MVEPGVDPTRAFDAILRAAASEGASDIHFEPKEDGLFVRFRLDGEMHSHARLPVAQREALLARGKIFGGMDITEKRLPQDGRAVLKERGRRFHLRLSTLPTVHGESLVIRLLDQTMPGQDFAQLGLAEPQADALRAALAGPAGLIYLTGPTGSGKTTTLHAALHALDHQGRVIHTLEDPVEYEFPGIRQTEIREKIGLTFATSLRALLRQNPDILLVGETRDAETAQLAIRAALTGHLVLSTLHTNDALAAIPRLRDLGVESFCWPLRSDWSRRKDWFAGFAPSARHRTPRMRACARCTGCPMRNSAGRWGVLHVAVGVSKGGWRFTRSSRPRSIYR